MNELINFWNNLHKNSSFKQFESTYALAKEQEFPSESKVLELAGGIGNDAIHFANNGHMVVLADASDYALSVAEERALEEDLAVVTIPIVLGEHKLPFEDEIFDVVYSRLGLHYFDVATFESVLEDSLRTLVNGGKMFITLKSNRDKREQDYFKNNAQEVEPNVYFSNNLVKSRFSEEQLDEILRNLNISDYEVNEYTEQTGSRNDVVFSGNPEFLLNEIIITK